MVAQTATPGVVIAAPASGTGKTTIATGLIAALARRMDVAPFKVGPDYIDSGYHGLAAGRPGRNLDSVMCGAPALGPLYAHGAAGTDIAVVEGVMGLFDGRIGRTADADIPQGSTAEVAGIVGLPVVLVVDVRGMSQSVGAVVRGFATAHPEVRIAAAIINMVGSDRHAEVCRRAVEGGGVPVVGMIPRVRDMAVPSRHLGLVTVGEHGPQVIEAMADHVAEYVDLDAIVDLAFCTYSGPAWDPHAVLRREQSGNPTVAMASGPAFTFSYAEHTELLRAAGAKVVTFDPLREDLPEADGLILPGGFPEEHLAELAANAKLRASIRKHAEEGKPIHAECAGLLYLLDQLADTPMAGVVPTSARMRRLTLGYREAVATSDSVLYRAGERITGHEFHHTALDHQRILGWEPAWGWRSWSGDTVQEGFVRGGIHASYLHVHPAALPQAVARFVASCTPA